MKQLRLAQKLSRQGDYLGAGDLYQDGGDYEKALKMYARAQAHERSAMLLKRLGQIGRASCRERV